MLKHRKLLKFRKNTQRILRLAFGAENRPSCVAMGESKAAIFSSPAKVHLLRLQAANPSHARPRQDAATDALDKQQDRGAECLGPCIRKDRLFFSGSTSMLIVKSTIYT